MANVLIVAEHAAGHLKKATLHALGAGRALATRTGGALTVALLGKDVAPVAQELAAYGAEVRVVDAAGLDHYLAESYGPLVVEVARAVSATYVGGAATAFGKDLLPRVAGLLGAAMASEVLELAGDGPDVLFRRPMWAGNVVADVELTTPVKVFTIRSTEFPAAERSATLGAVVAFQASLGAQPLRTRFVEFRAIQSDRPELTEARVVVAGGRGTKGNFTEIEAFADALGGAVGATRAAIDAGWVPNDWQVGQTGKVVAPELYIGAGISGAIQHIAGMKGSKVIVAINKDADAPIFKIADYGLVADLFKALPELRQKVAAGR
jgi:electron transfer flavoprotein alpha subunit